MMREKKIGDNRAEMRREIGEKLKIELISGLNDFNITNDWTICITLWFFICIYRTEIKLPYNDGALECYNP
jgi:hypothetical protein